MFDLCLASLEDNVADIRLSAASNLYEIMNVFDNEWATNKLIPSLIEKIHASNHYLHRLIYLLSFKYLSEGLGVSNNDHLIKEIVHFMTNDQVANVRFKSCQIITFLATNKLIHESLIDGIHKKLQIIIENDDDVDVRYFAQQSIQALSN